MLALPAGLLDWRAGIALLLLVAAGYAIAPERTADRRLQPGLFGVAHAAGGIAYVMVAGLAGVGYGLAYRVGGLQAAMLAHFGLNLAHFTLFTYPLLAS